MAKPPLGRVLERRVEQAIRDALEDTRVVLVNGARQSGKSTLLRQIARGGRPRRTGRDAAFRDRAVGADACPDQAARCSLLAARSGQLLVAASLGSDAGISQATALRYLSLLEEVFLIKRIPAWSRNLGNRALKTPKANFVDSGIAANLLGADARSLVRPGGPFGELLEGFVVMEPARQATWGGIISLPDEGQGRSRRGP